MLTARVDIVNNTAVTVDVTVIVYPTEPGDPQIGAIDVVDNSSPPISLLGVRETMPDCVPNVGASNPPLRIMGIPLTRLPIQVHVFLCMTGEMRVLGTFLQEMSPRGGAVPCGNAVILPPAQLCLDAQTAVSNARETCLRDCENIANARARRESAIAGAAATGAIGIGAAAGAAAILAALIQAVATATAAATTAAAAAAAAATVPIVGWIAAAALAAIAVGFLIAASIYLAHFNDAQNDLTAAYSHHLENLQAFHDAVTQVRTACCPQHVPSTLNLETPTCP